MMRDLPKAKANMKEGNKVAASYQELVPRAKGRFYEIKSRDDPK